MVSGFLSCFELKLALAELRSATGSLEAYYVLILTYGQALDIVEPAVLLSEGELHVSGGYLLSRGERLEHEGESGQLAAEGLAD